MRYSGHYLVLPESVDPSQWVFMDGGTQGINLEHVYPQSKGATNGTPANSDLHHLFPTRVKVNSDRGSFPFGEIPDASTQRWYYMTSVTSGIPSSNIDLYSEWNNAFFEPREDFKGNVARATFYFYTMYQDQALAADPDFFELQRSTLLEWHELDPANEDEIMRSERVAIFQDDQINPFVADPTLASRAFCMEGEECLTVGVKEFIKEKEGISAYIADGSIKIKVSQSTFEEVDVEVFNIMGRRMYASQIEMQGLGLYELNDVDLDFSIRLLLLSGKGWTWHALLLN